MSSSAATTSKRERDLDSLLRHIRGVRSLLSEAKTEGSTSRSRALEKVGLAQSALDKARDDVDHIKRNTVDAENASKQTATLQEELQQARGSFQTEHEKYVKLLEDVRELRLHEDTTRAEQAKCAQLQAELSHMKDERDHAALEYRQTVTPLMILPLLSAIANHCNGRLLNASKNPLPSEQQIMALARGPHAVISASELLAGRPISI
ncbi:hypothetical protein BCR35DRAFT_312998 [Leucosporidium creatinivorum]|uniref:Uncharacterized protein n=1 Tax=Leucosporidium creatinivorum TaxID=106004 RepID=A0A1Y2FYI4_9BASI|nr:hypothetical protein BCR35DRAFT_312998 [Leucosporidium creatinivorum]